MTSIQNVPANSVHAIEYRPEIDGLRAIAVTLVILVHAFPSYLQNGYIGVDIFFVISGFLITSILLTQLRAGSFTLRGFYIRRANRIFPALILVLIASIGFGWLSLYADEYKLLGRSIGAGAGFAANINFFLEGGYWDISATLKPLLHLWSLGVEEQFYLLWPVLLWSAWTRRFNIAAILIAIISISLVWNLRTTVTDQPAAFYLPFSRFWELLAGGALAYAGMVPPAERPKTLMSLKTLLPRLVRCDIRWVRSATLSNVCAFLGLALIVATLAQSYPPEKFPGWHAILPVIGTVLIIAAGSGAWLNSKVLSHRWVVYIGLISYPLYVWHWPLLTFGRILDNGEMSDQSRNLALFFTLALSVATYHLVERPIRVSSYKRGLKAIVLFGLLVGCGAAGFLIYANDGVEARYAIADLPTKNLPPPPHVSSASKVALLGDSNAGQFHFALFRAYKEKLIPYATPGWPYLVGTSYRPGLAIDRSHTGTPEQTDKALAQILSDPEVEVVIIAHMFQMYGPQDTLRSFPESPPGETSAMAYEVGLRRTLKLLAGGGKKVVYVKSIPFIGNVAAVVACSSSSLPIQRAKPRGCVTDLTEVQQYRRSYDELVARAIEGLSGVSVFDTIPYLCDEHHCYVERNGTLMYHDVSHLSVAGSIPVGDALTRFVEMQREDIEAKQP